MTLLLLLAAPVDFQRDIAPLLARRCLECHSGADPKGALDLSRKASALEVLNPGKPGASGLYRRVRDDRMPPKHPLPADEKELVRRWIAEGAVWEGDIDPFRATTPKRAGHDWWSLQPVKRPAVPVVAGASNPLDAFLLEKLRKAKLEPSPEAPRRVLARRLSFGLAGLPPSPEAVDAFIKDTRPDAYERLADSLLSSPSFGEKWARHWLDVARYGESDGFERDLPRFNSWPYRDWVVRAINEDLPADDFARLQLAGDLLRPGDPDALAATGFLVAGPHDIVVPVAENMKNAMRQDELEDIVGTTGQAFLGLTVHCARCHDHKFDPVAQRDYFRLVSALAGVGHGERAVPAPATARRLLALRERQEKLRAELESVEGPVRKRLLAAKGKPDAPRPRWAWDFTRSLDADGLKGALHGTAKRGAEGLRLDGKGWVSTSPLPEKLEAKTLQAWVRLANTAQRGGGAVSVQALDGSRFDAIVYGEQLAGRWMPGSEGFFRTKALDGPAEKSTSEIVHVAIAWDADGTVRAYRNGAPYGKPYKTDRQAFAAGESQVLFGLRHSPEGGNRFLAGTIVRASIHDRALKAEEIAGTAFVTAAEIAAALAGA
ncbi:MAG: DUF1549 domain-containing protein, partial [Gemmataceae bacterium]|nr:DUF1549 domain-containing protein [Gemmataceae bacterium]